MKLIQIDPDVQQYFETRGLELGESVSSILRRELHLPPPPGTVEIDDDVYEFLVSRVQAAGETASVILRRELHIGGGPPPGPLPPTLVEFQIGQGVGVGAWNLAADPVVAHVGDTLRIHNFDGVPHQPHTPGRPFAHPSMPIVPGASMDFVLTSTFDPVHDGPLTDHLGGPTSQFFLQVLQ